MLISSISLSSFDIFIKLRATEMYEKLKHLVALIILQFPLNFHPYGKIKKKEKRKCESTVFRTVRIS